MRESAKRYGTVLLEESDVVDQRGPAVGEADLDVLEEPESSAVVERDGVLVVRTDDARRFGGEQLIEVAWVGVLQAEPLGSIRC